MDIPRKIHTLPSLDGRYIILFTFYPTYRESIVILSLSMEEGKVLLSLSPCDSLDPPEDELIPLFS